MSVRIRSKTLVRVCAAFGAAAIVLSAALYANAAKQTRVLVFMPWTSKGLQHGFGISSRVQGLCWTHSVVTRRPDAWRCTADNDIYDPCFVNPTRSEEVVCAETPFSRSLLFMHLSKPLAANRSAMAHWLQHKGEPWALQLDNGDKCAVIAGATDIVAGKRLNYACVRSGWVAGFPDRSAGTTWTAEILTDAAEKHLETLRIMTAVF